MSFMFNFKTIYIPVLYSSMANTVYCTQKRIFTENCYYSKVVQFIILFEIVNNSINPSFVNMSKGFDTFLLTFFFFPFLSFDAVKCLANSNRKSCLVLFFLLFLTGKFNQPLFSLFSFSYIYVKNVRF